METNMASLLMRRMAAEPAMQDGSAKTLRAGQLVRGIVLQWLGEQEAMVQIGGSSVRAKVEAMTAQGQAMLFQVLEAAEGKTAVLRPMAAPPDLPSATALPQLLQQLGMKDTPQNRMLLRALEQFGMALNKENASQMQQALQSLPAAERSSEPSAQSAALALSRGLPLVPAAMTALRQTVFGPPLHQLLHSLQAAAEQTMTTIVQPGSTPGNGEASSSGVQRLAGQLLQMLGSLERPMLAQPAAAASLPTLNQSSGTHASLQPSLPPPTAAPSTETAGGARNHPIAAAGNVATSGASAAPAASSQADAASGMTRSAASVPAQTAAESGSPVVALASATGEARADGGRITADWIGRLMKAIGLDLEQRVGQQSAGAAVAKQAEREQADTGASLPRLPELPVPAGAQRTAAWNETVKGLLLQLVAAEEAPAMLKEAAQQTLQHITGQQLLLSGDRAAMLAQVTLFLPLSFGDGGQTAAVHIEARKGKRGELDAANCRLLFDLQMKHLGATVVDVHIVDRMVSLTVHNDSQPVSGLLASFRDELAEGLQSVGYQFLSMSCVPFPTRGKEQAETAQSTASSAASYYGKPYKGVDLRV